MPNRSQISHLYHLAFGEKKTRRAGLEISRKEYLTERRSRSVPGMLFPDERSSKSDRHAAIRADRSISCSADLRLSGCPAGLCRRPGGKVGFNSLRHYSGEGGAFSLLCLPGAGNSERTRDFGERKAPAYQSGWLGHRDGASGGL